jgi:hypothetical protein
MQTNSAEEYLEKKVKSIIESMAQSVMTDKPSEPVL